jgi:hypothetical protein
MNAEQLSTKVYEELILLDYARKANDFTKSGDTYFDTLFQEVQDAIRSFPILLVDHRNDLMDVDNLDGKQQFFIFKNDLGYYLIDTQGYSYPRYITELHQFEIEDEGTELNTFEYMEGMIRIANDQKFTAAVRYLVADFLEEGEFHKSDMLAFLQYKLNKAFEEVAEKL